MRLLLTSILLAVCAAAPPAPAQQRLEARPIPSAPRPAGTFHVATGTWTRASGTYGLLPQDTLFRNDRPSGYFGLQDEGARYTDEGRLPGAGVPLIPGQPETGTHDAYAVDGFQFAYCALDPARPVVVSLAFQDAYVPCSDPNQAPPTASFDLTGLPSGGCWVVAIDLSGTTQAFTLRAEGADGLWDDDLVQDSFGWSIALDHDQGNQTGPGAIAGLVIAGDLTQPQDQGNGTVFKNPGTTGTGLGSQDFFWIESPSVYTGCTWFGGCPPCASFELALFGQGEDPPPPACGSGSANSVSTAGAVLASTGGFGTASASFLVTSVPDQPGILYTGPSVIDLPFGCGRRCVGGPGVLRYGPYFPSGNQLSATIDMSISPNDAIQYWYRDPAFVTTCGDVFNLSNSIAPGGI